jgi:hypothetical protein
MKYFPSCVGSQFHMGKLLPWIRTACAANIHTDGSLSSQFLTGPDTGAASDAKDVSIEVAIQKPAIY